jgi:DNA-binding protein YbaB
MNIQKMLKQVQQMQSQMQKTQADLGTKTFEGSVAGGKVVAVANGHGDIQSIRLDREVVDSAEVDMLQDLVLLKLGAPRIGSAEPDDAMAEAPLDEDFGDDFDDEELGMEVESQIGKRVLEAFINDPILAERSLEIEADDDGDVLLHGSVRSPREVAHAVTLARGVPGVTRVRQHLRVRARR